MNKQVREIKDILKFNGVTIEKPSGEWIIKFYVDGAEAHQIFIAPECEDGEFMSASEVTEFNKILFFELISESYNSSDEDFLKKMSMAQVIATEFLIDLNKEWSGKDFRDFAKQAIKMKK